MWLAQGHLPHNPMLTLCCIPTLARIQWFLSHLTMQLGVSIIGDTPITGWSISYNLKTYKGYQRTIFFLSQFWDTSRCTPECSSFNLRVWPSTSPFTRNPLRITESTSSWLGTSRNDHLINLRWSCLQMFNLIPRSECETTCSHKHYTSVNTDPQPGPKHFFCPSFSIKKEQLGTGKQQCKTK